MSKLFVKKTSLQKPKHGLGFCSKTMQAKYGKVLQPLSSRKFDEDLEKKTLTSQGEMWQSVLSFVSNGLSAVKKPVPDQPETEVNYFQKSDKRFYFISKEKAIIKKDLVYTDPREYITYISNNPSHSIGVNLTTFREPDCLMVCDIDDAFVGNRIIEWATSSSKSDKDLFAKVFANPILIKTPSSGHLHLIYKCPGTISSHLNKEKLCSRLGFSMEYTFTNIELYSLSREIILKPADLSDLSALPEALFPYNYFQKIGFESLAQGVPLNPNCFPKSDCIPEGRRNNTLFNFFRVDNFSAENVLAANKLLCEPPLSDKEVLNSCERRFSKLNYQLDKDISPDQMRKPSCEFNSNSEGFDIIYTDFRMREDESLDVMYTNQKVLERTLNKFINKNEIAKFTEFYKFNLERVFAAIRAGTHINTMLLVAFLESEKDIFIESSSYLGKGTESFVIEYFLNYCGFGNKIMYVSGEETWYFWQGKVWETKTESDIDAIFQNFLNTEIRYGSLESRFTKNSSYKTILQSQTIHDEWPCRVPRGINFENGIALSDKDRNLIKIEHDPLLYHRSIFPCNFNPHASLTPIQMRFLNDIAGDSVMGLNVIRYVLFLAFVSNINQVGVYLNSEPGASKSTLVRLIQAIFKNSIVPLSISELKKGNTFQQDFATNKKGLVIAELSPNDSKNDTFRQWTKTNIGGDSQVAQKKFGNFYQHTSSIPLLIITSNYSSSSMPMWQDEAIKDRIIDVHMPKIQNISRIKDLETWVVQNLESLVNWVLQLPIDYVNDFTRVGELNAEFSSSKDPMQEFFMNQLVFIPNPMYGAGHGNQKAIRERKYDYVSSVLPATDLYSNFKNFLQTQNYEPFLKDYFETNANIKESFLKTLQKTIPSQRDIVSESRRGNERGFFHITFRERLRNEAKKTRYGSTLIPTTIKSKTAGQTTTVLQEAEITYVGRKQYSLVQIPKFSENSAVKERLLSDPLQYAGFCTHDSTVAPTVLIQTKPNGEVLLRKQAYACASLVANNNCKELIEKYPNNCTVSLGTETDKPLQIVPNLQLPVKTSDYHLSMIHTNGPKLFETENFQKYGTLSSAEIKNLKPLSNYSSSMTLPEQTISNFNPRNPKFHHSVAYTSLFLIFMIGETAINEKIVYEAELKPEIFLSPVDSNVYKTIAPNDSDEKAFRELLRETVTLFIQTLGVLPNQESFVITILTKLTELDLYPTLLFDFSIWTGFLVQEFPQYEPLFSSWSEGNNQYFFNLYRDIENFFIFENNQYEFRLGEINQTATFDNLIKFRKDLFAVNKTYADFYKNQPVDFVEKSTILDNLRSISPNVSGREVQEVEPENEDEYPNTHPDFQNFLERDFVKNDTLSSDSNVQTAQVLESSVKKEVSDNGNGPDLQKQESRSDINKIDANSTQIESEILPNLSKNEQDQQNQKPAKGQKRRGRPKGSKNKSKQ